MDRGELQSLIDQASMGDADAIRRLRKVTGGQFENTPLEETPPMFRAVHYTTDSQLPKSLDELRAERKYDVRVVNEFVDRACDETYLAPGAAMILFAVMCTKFPTAFRDFGGKLRPRLMALYRFWDESHPWVRANILFGMRERLYQEHHRKFCRAFADKAREYDKIGSGGRDDL